MGCLCCTLRRWCSLLANFCRLSPQVQGKRWTLRLLMRAAVQPVKLLALHLRLGQLEELGLQMCREGQGQLRMAAPLLIRLRLVKLLVQMVQLVH